MAIREYATTYGWVSTSLSQEPDIPEPPDDLEPLWTLAAAAVADGRVFWFWVREVPEPIGL
jgi:hypothetical protein